MPSIRKTKKRLKRELKKAIAEQEVIGELRADMQNLFLYEAVAYDIDQRNQELQKLKRKKSGRLIS